MKLRLNGIVQLLALGLLSATTIFAQSKPDATGTWKWTSPARNGGTPRETTLTLKQEGDKLTGSVTGRLGNETAIADGAVKGGEITFKVTREFGGNRFTMNYKGKLAGDAITGTIEFERDGQTNSRPWEAKRAGAAAAIDPTGTWKWAMPGRNGGPERQMALTLKLADGKLSGTLAGRRSAGTPISDAAIKGGEISFKVTRERNGQSMTQKFTAKLNGDTLKGTVEFERDGQTNSREWEAKREKAVAAGGATGTWKWTMEMNGNSIERTVKLVQDGAALKGSTTMRNNEVPIENGKVENGELSYQITREFNGNKIVVKYAGKVEGDKLTGKVEFKMNDNEPRTMDWNASRVKE
jgi:hypothetical protein